MYSKFTLSTLLCSTVLFIGAHATQAEPVGCKGMEQASCSESGSCRWVNSYKRSDGREVRGYCRKLPSKNAKDVSSREGVKASHKS